MKIHYPSNLKLQDKQWLYNKYIIQSLTAESIGTEIGTTKYSVCRALKFHGIKTRIHTSRYPQLNDKEWLTNQYCKFKKSVRQIAIEVGTTCGNVYSALDVLKIPMRDFQEAIRILYPTGRFGELSSNWKNGISKIAKNIRTCKRYKIWHKRVKTRDGNICQVCGGFGDQVDHIVSFAFILHKYSIKNRKQADNCSELWDINNGRVLCRKCHYATDTFSRQYK